MRVVATAELTPAEYIAALEARAEADAAMISEMRDELMTLEAQVMSFSRPRLDVKASFGRAVAQLKQMFPGLEIEVTAKAKEVTP